MPMEEKNNTSKDSLTSETTTFLLAEYNSLRDEILKLEELEHQLISLAIIAPGTLLAVGYTTQNASLLLLYPTLALFLSAVYTANVKRTFEIGDYIKLRIEQRVGENIVGWESFRPSTSLFYRIVGGLGSGGIFVGTELLVIFAAIFIAKFNTTEYILLVLAILSTILSVIILMTTAIQRYLNM